MTADQDSSGGWRGHIGNVVLPLVVLGIAATMLYLTRWFPDHDDVGAAAVPRLWIAFTAVFCVVLIVRGLRARGAPDPVPGRVGFVALFAAWMVLYLLVIEAVGYYVSTFVFLLGSMYMMGYRRPLIAVSVAASWLVLSYFIFAKLLYIPLPVGPLMAPVLAWL